MNYWSTPTLRFFMFFLLNQTYDDFALQSETTIWKQEWKGPFDLETILYDWHEMEALISDLNQFHLRGYFRECYFTNALHLKQILPAHMYNIMLPPVIVTNAPLFKKAWDHYIGLFKKDSLNSRTNVFSFEKHNQIAPKNILYPLFKKYGTNFIVQDDPRKTDIRLFESLWILQDRGLCEIERISEQPEKYLQKSENTSFYLKLTKRGEDYMKQFEPKQNKFSPKVVSKTSNNWDFGTKYEGIILNTEPKTYQIMYKGCMVSWKKINAKQYLLVKALIEGKGTCWKNELKKIWNEKSPNVYNDIHNAWSQIKKKFEKGFDIDFPFEVSFDKERCCVKLQKIDKPN